MSFGLYAIGFAILIGGLVYGAHLVICPRIGLLWVQLYSWASEFCRA
jgi:hypothetical protein